MSRVSAILDKEKWAFYKLHLLQKYLLYFLQKFFIFIPMVAKQTSRSGLNIKNVNVNLC